MSRADHIQFNIRSAYARARAHELAKLTGMTTTQIVEEALRGYVPPGAAAATGRMVRRGPILVRRAQGKKIGQVEADAALDAVRAADA
jgi:hypothetical protein